MMTKTRRILEINEDAGVVEMVAFENVNEESGLIETSILMLESDWREMDSPTMITLTIEAGDQLNLPGVYAYSEHVAEATEVPGPSTGSTEPLLGLATTKQLIQELEVRARVSEINGESWPLYRTVD